MFAATRWLLLAVLAGPSCVPNRREKAAADGGANLALAADTETVPRPRPSEPPTDGVPAIATVRAGPLITQPFEDAFERTDLGKDWRATSPVWRITEGRLCGRGARNHPVWLTRRLPTNARIEFDATSSSPDGDLKVEVWGDGRSAASGTSYADATSYLVIFGGWKNRLHVLARLDEHGKDRAELTIDPTGSDVRAVPVRPEQTYHFKIERSDARTVRFFVDDIEILSFNDSDPLRGPGHEHLGFNDWEAPVCFDNLKVTPHT